MKNSSPYTPVKQAEDFYSWIKSVELPKAEFDYDEVYKSIYDNFYELFGYVDGWESEYINILSINGKELSQYLFDQLSEEDKTNLQDNYDWDGSAESLIGNTLGDTQYANEKGGGGQGSAEFIKLFDELHKRKVLELFICSIAFNLRNNIGMEDMETFLSYKVR